MEKFTIIWSKKASVQLTSLPFPIKKIIYSKVGELETNPYRKSVKKLRGVDSYRLRIGDYRVIFDIEKNELRILILFLGDRKNVYKKFGL